MGPEERITLDGHFDEPVWTRAVPAADFIQIDPDNGRLATEPTEVRIAFDRDALYIGVTAHDSEPDKWLGYQRRRVHVDDRHVPRCADRLLLRDRVVGRRSSRPSLRS